MGVEVTSIKLHYSNLKEELLPLFLGKVFHVTTKDACSSIMAEKKIRNNMKGEREFVFPQSENSYGRKRGYVCLFDLRSATTEQIQDALMKFYFLNPFRHRSDPSGKKGDGVEFRRFFFHLFVVMKSHATSSQATFVH